MNPNPSILYVDDEPINLQLFELNFQSKYKVITRLSGFEGLEALQQDSKIQIVISDMRMPGMNGVEFITKAKKEFPNIIFFILTGYDISDEISEALSKKIINKYFQKPLVVSQIDSAIQAALAQQ